MTLDKAYEMIDGLKWNLNGVDGRLSVERINGMTEVIFTPSARGRRTKTYQFLRAQLSDDYTTTLTACEAEMQRIFGYVEMAEASYGPTPLG